MRVRHIRQVKSMKVKPAEVCQDPGCSPATGVTSDAGASCHSSLSSCATEQSSNPSLTIPYRHAFHYRRDFVACQQASQYCAACSIVSKRPLLKIGQGHKEESARCTFRTERWQGRQSIEQFRWLVVSFKANSAYQNPV